MIIRLSLALSLDHTETANSLEYMISNVDNVLRGQKKWNQFRPNCVAQIVIAMLREHLGVSPGSDLTESEIDTNSFKTLAGWPRKVSDIFRKFGYRQRDESGGSGAEEAVLSLAVEKMEGTLSDIGPDKVSHNSEQRFPSGHKTPSNNIGSYYLSVQYVPVS